MPKLPRRRAASAAWAFATGSSLIRRSSPNARRPRSCTFPYTVISSAAVSSSPVTQEAWKTASIRSASRRRRVLLSRSKTPSGS